MIAEYTVRMAWPCGTGHKVIVLTKFSFLKEFISYPMDDYNNFTKLPQDVGMWKIKTLKK
jgi:hypothetical protein